MNHLEKAIGDYLTELKTDEAAGKSSLAAPETKHMNYEYVDKVALEVSVAGVTQRYERTLANGYLQSRALNKELLAALERAQRMLQSIAGDLEDGIAPELRGKVCAAVLRAADDASAALAKAR